MERIPERKTCPGPKVRKQYILGDGGRPVWLQHRGHGRKRSQVGTERSMHYVRRALSADSMLRAVGSHLKGQGVLFPLPQTPSPPSECVQPVFWWSITSLAPLLGCEVPPGQSPCLQISIPMSDPDGAPCMLVGRMEECGWRVWVLVEYQLGGLNGHCR